MSKNAAIKSLSGKTALVTGGSRGIGAAIARKLAEQGANVAISYSNSEASANDVVTELKTHGVTAEAFKADQADSAQVRNLVKIVAQKFGTIDILVNNAGVFVTGPVDDANADMAGFARQQAINVNGVAAAVREVTQVMGEGGRIVTIGSVVGTRVPFPGAADYAATKAAVAVYSKGWARDLGKRKITVNVVQPGPIDTEMNPDNDGDFAQAIKSGLPLGRYGKAEEVAAAVAFLASPDASYITGAVLDVDGGLNA